MNRTETHHRVPILAFCALLVGTPLIILPESSLPGYYAKMFVLHVGVLVVAVYASIHKPTGRRTPLLLPLLAFLLLNLLAALQAVNPVDSAVTISYRVSLFAAFVLALSLLHRDTIPTLVTVVGCTSSITALIGFGQYAGLFGLDIPSSGMPSSTLGYRNFAAAYTIGAIPFIAAEITRRRDRSQILWAAMLCLNGTFLIATRTRAAWGACAISGLIGIGLYVWKARQETHVGITGLKRAAVVLAGATALALTVSLIIPARMEGRGYDRNVKEKTTVQGSIASTFEAGADKDRFTMWSNTLDMIASRPLVGVGPGNWQYVYPAFDSGEVTWKAATPRRPHNDYLWITAETGLPGLAAAGWLIIAALLSGHRALTASRDPGSVSLVVGTLTSLAAIGIYATFSFPIERITVTLLGMLALAILALHDPVTKERTRHPLPASLWHLLVPVVLGAATISWTAVRFDTASYRQIVSIDRQDWTGAIHHGTAAVREGILDPQVLMLRGLAYHMSGDYRRAIEDQQACLEYHPYFVNALNNLGMSLISSGRHDEAIQTLNRIEPINPLHVEGHLNLAKAYEGKGESGNAIEQLKRAVEKAPRRADILIELARHQEMEGDLDNAASALLTAADLRQESDVIQYRLGVIRQKQGDLRRAADRFRKVLSLKRDHVPILYNLGELYLASGDTARAIQAYQAFVNRWTGSPEAVEPVLEKLRSLR